MVKVLPDGTTSSFLGAYTTAYPGVASWVKAEVAKARMDAKTAAERIMI
jgi:hypothetical protein